ncbi:malectin domain-containing carbohydrate-binding protein [Pricia sp.]|uniref:malectin domain-containing carbohydrate-binding protein n=1 Tax=Pricia sp. TaxID=2268138 RepID=UPI0035947D19
MKKFYPTNISILIFLLFFTSVIQLHAQLPNEFAKVDLVTELENSTSFKFLPDGRIIILERFGQILIYNPDTQLAVSAGTLPVFHQLEDGLVGLAVDPDFVNNSKIYLHYSPNDFVGNRVSRFSLVGNQVDFSSEEIVLQWQTSRTAAYHSGGDMDFDSQGNLYIATGDNSGYPNGYNSISETNADLSAEKSSSNMNDLRGKILRIKPGAGTTYTIPPGNLFQNPSQGRPEIYVMGARNPYRIHVDKQNNDWLFWAEVGPDAENPGPQGPMGLDEINLTKASGNYGWPYFSGENNAPYQMTYANPPYFNDPLAPVNISQWNTGATDLPPAQPAWLDKPSECYLVGFRYNYDPDLPDDQRLPEEFDDLLIYYDFNSSQIWAIDTDAEGNLLSEEQVAPVVFPDNSDGFIDMEVGPDGKMYVLAYGAGCCPDNVGSGRLVRVDYTGITDNSPPNVVLEADVTNGPLPLTVNFKGDKTTDPNGDSPLTYAWDIDVDGTVDNPDNTQPNYTHTYTEAGTYTAQLRVDDGQGGLAAKTIVIYAGNSVSSFDFASPPDGGLFGWNDDIAIDLNVTDAEEGAIACADINVVPSVGHVNHFHDELTIDGCPKTITISDNNHNIDGEEDIFFVLGANYTDSGGLTSRDQIQLHPKRKEAEYYDTQSGTEILGNSATFGGGNSAISVGNNGFISFTGRNLSNMTAVKYLVAAGNAGGTIEFRTGGPTGTLVATTVVPNTGGIDDWVEVQTPITDPGGKNDLFFVFRGTSGQDIFRLNYVEFVGAGVSTDNSPPKVNSVKLDGNTRVSVLFSEYVSPNTAQTIANYAIDNGISVSAAELQSDNRTVVLTTSPLATGVGYTLTISNVQNTAGLPMATASFDFSVFEAIRINSGGGEVTLNGTTFSADQYNRGGQVFSNTTPIQGTTEDQLYQVERFAEGTNNNEGTGGFGYEIPVGVAGEYDIRLHFAEIFFGLPGPGGAPGGPGSRIFNVVIEGQQVLTDFDILAETDPATVLLKEFDNIPINDGFASIILSGVVQGAKINGIEVLSSDAFGGGETDADITITSPSNGWEVNQPFEVAFRIENWRSEQGDGHLHYLIDGGSLEEHEGYGPIAIDGLAFGNHTIRLELFNPDDTPSGIFDEVTVNVTSDITCNVTPFPESWTVHELEANTYTAVYTFADDDLDGDGLKDIVTGGWWYKNPGTASGDWVKNTIGENFGNVVHVYDFDGDGNLDLLGTALGIAPDNEYESAQLLWAQNDGEGNFTVFNNIPAGTTDFDEPFLAGLAGGVFDIGGPYQMAINWNGAESTGSPVQMLTPSANPTTGTWTLEDISPDSSGEDIQAGDIDQDGDLDLFQGINWLRNNGNTNFETFDTGITYTSTPDRAQLADFDRDGDLDAVVGQLGLGGTGNRNEFAWFAAPADPTQPWVKNVLDTDVRGSLSVFAIDIDFDGDKDIVVGEWLGEHRLLAFENDLCGSGEFNLKVLDDGALDFEHHDGARVTDIDNDGDYDVISNGWLNDLVPRIYENTTLPPSDDRPLANAGEDRTAAPGSSVTLTGSGSDPDGGEIVSYLWTQVSGPTATLNGANTTTLTINNLVEGVYVLRLTVTDDEGDNGVDEVTVSVSAQGNVNRINAGGPAYTFGGTNWAADQYSNGGIAFTNNTPIANTDNDQLYQTERYRDNGPLIYEIPVANGMHDVNLHFAEIYWGLPGDGANGGAGSRLFNIDIEGQARKENYDIFTEAGGAATAIVESFTDISVTDQSLTITLERITDFPKISGIEILPAEITDPDPDPDPDPDVELKAVAEATPTTGSSPLEVSFTGSNSLGDIVSYLWDFKDGNTATVADPANTFLAEGTYEVSLTITDAGGISNTATLSIVVSDTPTGEVMGVLLEQNPPKEGIAIIRILNQPDNFMMLGVNVHDVQGRLLSSYRPEEIIVNNDTYQVPVHILKAGLYFFEIAMNQGKAVTLKVLIQN